MKTKVSKNALVQLYSDCNKTKLIKIKNQIDHERMYQEKKSDIDQKDSSHLEIFDQYIESDKTKSKR